ncbi:hypothetical protein M758_UG014500 [Ceratodon purpureus]|nr:hypothetical protein M758_UG014500 [Ceratodon purpureus]
MDNAHGNGYNGREGPGNMTQSNRQYPGTGAQGNEGEENVHTASDGVGNFPDSGNHPAIPEEDVNNNQPTTERVTVPPIYGSSSDFDSSKLEEERAKDARALEDAMCSLFEGSKHTKLGATVMLVNLVATHS